MSIKLIFTLPFILLFMNSGTELTNSEKEENICTITFYNETWEKVQVEVVSKGKNYYCSDAPVVRRFTLYEGEEFEVNGLEDACWRAKLPNSKGFSKFYSISCSSYGGKRCKISTVGYR